MTIGVGAVENPLVGFPSGGGRRSSVHGRGSVHTAPDSRTMRANFHHLTGRYQLKSVHNSPATLEAHTGEPLSGSGHGLLREDDFGRELVPVGVKQRDQRSSTSRFFTFSSIFRSRRSDLNR